MLDFERTWLSLPVEDRTKTDPEKGGVIEWLEQAIADLG